MLFSVILLNFLFRQEGCCYTVLPLALLWDVHLCLSQHGWSTHYHLVVWQVLGSPEINHAEPSTTTVQESKADKLL